MSKIADTIEKLDQGIALLKKLEAIEIPENLKQAAKEEWVEHLGPIANLLALTIYPRAQRMEDKTRAVRVADVITLLQWMETEQIDAGVTNVLDVIADGITATYQLGYRIAEGVVAIVRSYFRDAEDANAILIALLTHFISALSAGEIVKQLKSTVAIGSKFAGHVRDAALPQRSATRHVRVKRSRRN